jgi:hypothetical protein
MHAEYVEQRNGGYYVAGTRISLDSVVCSFNEGQSPEAIQEDLEETEREFEGSGIRMSEANPVLWEKIQRARAKVEESCS